MNNWNGSTLFLLLLFALSSSSPAPTIASPRDMGVGGKDVLIPLREVLRGVSMQLVPLFQSPVLRTVCGLSVTGGGRVAFPCVRVLAGPGVIPKAAPNNGPQCHQPFCQTLAATACPSEVVTDFGLPTAYSSLPACSSASETSCVIPAPWQSWAGWGPAVPALPAELCSSLQLLCTAGAFPRVRAGSQRWSLSHSCWQWCKSTLPSSCSLLSTLSEVTG